MSVAALQLFVWGKIILHQDSEIATIKRAYGTYTECTLILSISLNSDCYLRVSFEDGLWTHLALSIIGQLLHIATMCCNAVICCTCTGGTHTLV